MKTDVEKSPSGRCWYVVELVTISGRETRAHRDTCKSRKAALDMAAELRRGARRYDVERGHTVPTDAEPNPLDALLGSL